VGEFLQFAQVRGLSGATITRAGAALRQAQENCIRAEAAILPRRDLLARFGLSPTKARGLGGRPAGSM
jgi:hypothetical protein